MILIVAPPNDGHALCVAKELTALGRQYRIVDSQRLSEGGKISFRAGRSTQTDWTDIDGARVPMHDVKTVWHRRRYMPSSSTVGDDDERLLIQREWSALFSGLFQSLHAWFVNDPLSQEAAAKPLQLRLAQEIGLTIPDTLITNDPAEVEAFLNEHHEQVIHKTLCPPSNLWLATTKWSPAHRAALADLPVAPVIFQEVVTDCRELRVTVIGDELFAAEFRPPAGLIDGRMDLSTPYRRHQLPSVVADRLLALVRALGLVYSTIDLKLTDDGEYVFLELNPQGQFLYIEILTTMPITAAMARLLSNGVAKNLCAPEGTPRARHVASSTSLTAS